MNKELEALLDTLEDIKKQLIVREVELQELKLCKMSEQAKILHKQSIEEWFEPLKSALERKEKLEEVWEIIKEKPNDYYFLVNCEFDFTKMSYEQYKTCIYGYYKQMYDDSLIGFTETEFNLLKEMLKEKGK